MEKINIKITRINNSFTDLPLPEYATMGSSGMDLRATIEQDFKMLPGERALIPCGFQLEIPIGYEAQIRPRSGIAIKYGITVLNSPGTIDSDYRGEVKVILINLSQDEFVIHRGDRIAQMVITRVSRADLMEVTHLEDSARGEDGFGHTGT